MKQPRLRSSARRNLNGCIKAGCCKRDATVIVRTRVGHAKSSLEEPEGRTTKNKKAELIPHDLEGLF